MPAEPVDRLADWIALVDDRYPERDAEPWDATGLQVGDPQTTVSRVLVCLDVTPATLEEAERMGADLVLAHHPLLFRPLRRLTPETASGRLALRAARAGIAVLAAHTNLDVAVPGTSDPVAELLGLRDLRPLRVLPGGEDRVKLVTFVPRQSTGAVLAALTDAGAGQIGDYSACSFRVEGTGTFLPSGAAHPSVGQPGRHNEVPEDRLEMVVPRARLVPAITSLLAVHPYEEVVWDAYPLVDEDPRVGRRKGLGLVGELPSPLSLREVAAQIAERLPAPHIRLAGDPSAAVLRVAVCGGAGDSLIDEALAAEVDVYVTGDLRHHVTLDARTQGLAVIDAGHYPMEAAALPTFLRTLAEAAAQRGLAARLIASSVPTDPWVDDAHPRGEARTDEGERAG